ncbi:Fur-regulated basic protein B [Lentibacillus halodurans]|uniref:Fur-regulated basic protein B n=1 Tax=Lentibacillus halodurans TaxID=237679 RepID=A0A1I1AFQ3_9BACI|nr:FbpB family small basic protein [Lentibacillus halodurans]SFB35328.1 Fur-regulated basic protein B [Lentibacillus halodurans]
MRPKYQSFEELVQQNKQELWEDEYKLNQIEQRLDKKVTSQQSDKMGRLPS